MSGNVLDVILSGKPFQPEQESFSLYRVREALRGSRADIDYAKEYLMAVRHWQGIAKLGVYRYDSEGEKPAELLSAFRLERLR